MRTPPRAINIPLVERTTAYLELAIDVDSDPISGSVTNGGMVSRPFSGWIDLVAAIEAARSSDPGTDTPFTHPRLAEAKTLGSIPGAKAAEL